jgi:hypothetical protein
MVLICIILWLFLVYRNRLFSSSSPYFFAYSAKAGITFSLYHSPKCYISVKDCYNCVKHPQNPGAIFHHTFFPGFVLVINTMKG